MGWTRGTKHIPDLGLLGYLVGSLGTMGLYDGMDKRVLTYSRPKTGGMMSHQMMCFYNT